MEIAAPARLAAHETELASFPDVYFRLKEEMDSPRSSVSRITGLIGRDVNLSAKLLRLANSPLYGFSGPVETIERAVALIGMEQITTLALGVTAINYFKGIPHELVDMRSFWRHAVSCGLLAKLLASAAGLNNAERYFVEGLLHDVGRLILFKKMPYASTDALLYARENRVPMVEAERTTFSYIHTDVSRPLLAHWSFPTGLCDGINNHHDPLQAETRARRPSSTWPTCAPTPWRSPRETCTSSRPSSPRPGTWWASPRSACRSFWPTSRSRPGRP
jgi:HD-like signal output (HDOD) protein